MPGPSRPPRYPGRRALATLMALVLVPGCATTNTDVNVPVVGRTVTLVTGPAKEKVVGELLAVEKDRLYVVTSFLQAAMSAQGVQGLYDEAEEPEPMAVICYKLEGDVIAAR